jgi:ketosteroid isomerase-like protein
MRGIQTSLALLGATAFILTLPGCQKYERHEAGEHASVDAAAIASAIKADEKSWSDQFQARPRSLDALVSHYAPEAFFIAPGVKPTSGIADIRKTYEEALKDPNFNIRFAADKVDVAASGDYAISQGRFTETFTEPATKQAKSDSGTFLTVYKKQDDGSWKVVQDWAVADPAP